MAKIYNVRRDPNNRAYAIIVHHDDSEPRQFYPSGAKKYGSIFCDTKDDFDREIKRLKSEGYIQKIPDGHLAAPDF